MHLSLCLGYDTEFFDSYILWESWANFYCIYSFSLRYMLSTFILHLFIFSYVHNWMPYYMPYFHMCLHILIKALPKHMSNAFNEGIHTDKVNPLPDFCSPLFWTGISCFRAFSEARRAQCFLAKNDLYGQHQRCLKVRLLFMKWVFPG